MFTQKRFASGGALADMGIHALGTVRFMLGDPRPISVYAKLGTRYKDFDMDAAYKSSKTGKVVGIK